MRGLPVYAAEREAGLVELLQSSRATVLTAPLTLSDPFPIPEKTQARLRQHALAGAHDQPDLYFMKSVMVTAGTRLDSSRAAPCGLNLNTDFFDTLETWAARHSPEDKQVNYQHDCAEIIGHIIANTAIDDEGHEIAEDGNADDLPDKLHLVTGSVLYRYWEKDDLQEKMDTLLKEIAEEKWYVSMECLFRGFDYLLVDAAGACRVVARNAQTAFLTKHLRAYGGDGTYKGERIGRVLRNIVFSGLGLVKRPANPESVIYTQASPADGPAHAPVCENSQAGEESGYCSVTEGNNEEISNTMAVELETLQKQVADLKAENEAVKADSVKAREKAEAEVADLKKKLADAEQLGASLAQEKTKLAEQLAQVEKQWAETKAEVQTLQAERQRDGRIKLVMAELKLDEAKAVELVDSLIELSEEKFASHVKAMTGWVTNNPQSGNTSAPTGKTVQTPSKSTPAPLPSPVTGKPVNTKVSAVELDSASPTPEPALAVETDAGAESVRKSIAAHFGYKPEGDAEAE